MNERDDGAGSDGGRHQRCGEHGRGSTRGDPAGGYDRGGDTAAPLRRDWRLERDDSAGATPDGDARGAAHNKSGAETDAGGGGARVVRSETDEMSGTRFGFRAGNRTDASTGSGRLSVR